MIKSIKGIIISSDIWEEIILELTKRSIIELFAQSDEEAKVWKRQRCCDLQWLVIERYTNILEADPEQDEHVGLKFAPDGGAEFSRGDTIGMKDIRPNIVLKRNGE